MTSKKAINMYNQNKHADTSIRIIFNGYAYTLVNSNFIDHKGRIVKFTTKELSSNDWGISTTQINTKY